MRQFAGKQREKRLSASGRNEVANQEATVSPTPSRLTTVARVASPVLLKTTSSPQARLKRGLLTQSIAVLASNAQRTQSHISEVAFLRGPLMRQSALRFGPIRDLRRRLTKYGHVLAAKAILTPYRAEEKYWQYPAFKGATFS
jgi:hypothetical protein